MMGNVTIRAAKTEDVPSLFRWGEENPELWGDPDTKWYSENVLHEWISHPREDVLLVAEVDGMPVGMCMNNYIRNWAYCSGLFVRKEYRRHGIAREMVNRAMMLLKPKGAEELVFLVHENNMQGMDFYRKISCTTGQNFVWMYKRIS